MGETLGYLVKTRDSITQMIEALDKKIDTRVAVDALKAKLKRRKVKWLNKVRERIKVFSLKIVRILSQSMRSR